MTYQLENNILTKNFYKRMFFDNWKKGKQQIEFLIENPNGDNIDKNTILLKNWLRENNYHPEIIIVMKDEKCKTCTIQNRICVRIDDLSIVPCRGLSYPWYIVSKFKVKDSKIVDIESKNFQIDLVTKTNHVHNFPFCN